MDDISDIRHDTYVAMVLGLEYTMDIIIFVPGELRLSLRILPNTGFPDGRYQLFGVSKKVKNYSHTWD